MGQIEYQQLQNGPKVLWTLLDLTSGRVLDSMATSLARGSGLVKEVTEIVFYTSINRRSRFTALWRLRMPNFIHPSAFVEEGAVLEEDVKIWHLAHVRAGSHLGKSVSIGKDVYVDAGVIIGEGSRVQNGVNIYKGVQVGSWCFIGPGAVFTNDQYPRVGRITWDVTETILEDGCSIGAGAIIRCGIKIGAFAMVGAGAVVTKDIPPFCLVTGVPAELTHRVCACGETTIPLISWVDECIRPCCRKHLHPQVLKLAEEKILHIEKRAS